jgi:hypothetical protein
MSENTETTTDTGATYTLTLTGGPVEINKARIDADTARQVVEAVMGGGDGSSSSAHGSRASTGRRRRSKGAGDSKKPGGRRRGKAPGVVSDLSLRPNGKKPFHEFATEKSPNSHPERQAVIVHWLRHEGGVAAVAVDHVNTCYQGVDWRRPNNLQNSLQVTASTTGWLETSNMSDIQLTVPGEEFVKHELPRAQKA